MNYIFKTFYIVILLILLPGCSCAQEKLFLDESFDYPDGALPAQWWFEGDSAFIRDGRIYVDSDNSSKKVSTIWLDKVFQGNLSVEFDVQVVSSVKLSNNINFFLFYSGIDGEPLRDSRNARMDGKYPNYHKLNGYIFTHLANGNEDTARFRFRYNPGFNLLEEKFTYECRRGVTYHVKIIVKDKTFQYWTDNNLIFEKTVDDNSYLEQGIIGFRTFHTCLWWDNLKIKQL